MKSLKVSGKPPTYGGKTQRNKYVGGKPHKKSYGTVYLIGAGPGDPSLITLKGKQCLERADVVVYDFLVNPRIVAYANPKAQKIYVGKNGGKHTQEQGEINRLLVTYAQKGKIIARLKGGDPFVFGRGGEEAEFLAEHTIPFEIVPGISSAIAAPAYAGIPITHRDCSSMFTVVTGQQQGNKKKSTIQWDKISPQSTLIILMGMENLTTIINELRAHGWDMRTPAALVRWGTLPFQQSVTGRLNNIVTIAKKADIKPPVVIVIGSAVNLREKLRWFDNKPLFGRKIIITRAREQASALAGLLEDNGAEVIQFPTIKIVPAKDYRPLDTAIRALQTYDWLIFTSVNGVEYFWKRFELHGNGLKNIAPVKTCAIGPKTAERMRSKGLRVDRIAQEYRAEAVIHELGRLKNKKVLIPRARVARDVLPDELKKRKASVNVVTAYETVTDTSNIEQVKNLLFKANPDVDCITFTSSSTVKNFMECFTSRERKKIFKTVTAASIGPVTAQTIRGYGVKPAMTAKRYTIEGLTESIVRYKHWGKQ